MKEIILFSMSSYENKNIVNWILNNLKEQYTFVANPFDESNWKYGKKRLANSNDSFLIYNIEDKLISSGMEELKNKTFDYSISKENKTKILILQDPYNLFADRYKFQNKNNKNLTSKYFFECWENHAKEINYPTITNLIINYNQWIISKKYRNSIARKLNLKQDNNQPNINVLKKYKQYKYDKNFMSLFEKNTNELAKEIFKWNIK